MFSFESRLAKVWRLSNSIDWGAFKDWGTVIQQKTLVGKAVGEESDAVLYVSSLFFEYMESRHKCPMMVTRTQINDLGVLESAVLK